ncbi:integumentary mucin C.1 [Scaptodrosophila lebanonensis]|uniref:Integumentary mucin C.1 n=1 Tax=Drosophila lebanonensis TaxID=7225 RepID=A0A6J2T523_DROLE|nr:integumentary mucin C.1 [Scaptodrosophila lebanonensis]
MWSGSASNYRASASVTATTSPINSQLVTNLLTQKINVLQSLIQAKFSSGGAGGAGGIGFGFNKFGSVSSTTTTTTEAPYTYSTTEVNTDFTPDITSSTHSVSTTTTTEGSNKTPEPTVHPYSPITTRSTTPLTPVKSTTEGLVTTTAVTEGYSYQTPKPNASTEGYAYQTPRPDASTSYNSVSGSVSSFYLPTSLA